MGLTRVYITRMPTHRIRAVVVEANVETAGQYALWLPDHWSVTVVESGDAALSTVDSQTHVVIVGSVQDQSVYRFLRRIRSRGSDAQILVIADEDGQFDPDVHDVDAIVPSPIDRESFREAIDRLADRVAYDERLEEYYSLVSRKAVMEARTSPDGLADSEEYRNLVSRTDDVSDRLDDLLDDIAEVDDYPSVFRGFFPGAVAPEE